MVKQRWCDGTRDCCSHVDAIKMVNIGVQSRRNPDGQNSVGRIISSKNVQTVCPKCGKEECQCVRILQHQEMPSQMPTMQIDQEVSEVTECACCGRELGNDCMVVCHNCGKVNRGTVERCSCCSTPVSEESRIVCPVCHSESDPHLTDAYHHS